MSRLTGRYKFKKGLFGAAVLYVEKKLYDTIPALVTESCRATFEDYNNLIIQGFISQAAFTRIWRAEPGLFGSLAILVPDYDLHTGEVIEGPARSGAVIVWRRAKAADIAKLSFLIMNRADERS